MDKETELISIVLPVFNEEAGIENTIDSLENFTANQPQNFELIFIDDGSSDQSAKLIVNSQAYHSNIKLVQFPEILVTNSPSRLASATQVVTQSLSWTPTYKIPLL